MGKYCDMCLKKFEKLSKWMDFDSYEICSECAEKVIQFIKENKKNSGGN